MSVRRKKGTSKWVADVVVGYKPDGTLDRKTKTCETEREAHYWEHVFSLRGQNPNKVDSDKVTFREFVEGVYWPMKANLAANTARGYRRDIKLRLMPAFGDMPITQINSYHIQMMINSCPSRKVATNARETLSAILSAAQGLQLIPSNPACFGSSGIRYNYPPASKRTGTMYGEWLSNYSDHVKLLDFVRVNFPGEVKERLVVLGLCFGLRPEEVTALDWESVDFENRRIHVMQAYIQVGGKQLVETKTRKNRFVPMQDYAYERMLEWEHCLNTVPNYYDEQVHPVITTYKGNRLSQKYTSYHIRMLRENYTYPDGTPLPKITQESFRHSFATAGIRSGVPVETMSVWLGHERTSTTYNRYVKPNKADVQSDIEIVNAAVRAAISAPQAE